MSTPLKVLILCCQEEEIKLHMLLLKAINHHMQLQLQIPYLLFTNIHALKTEHLKKFLSFENTIKYSTYSSNQMQIIFPKFPSLSHPAFKYEKSVPLFTFERREELIALQKKLSSMEENSCTKFCRSLLSHR